MKDNISIVKNCCGCRACEQACPKKCISMKYDSEGFLVPVINDSVCINCGKCLKSCAQHLFDFKNEVLETYAALHNDKNILMSSTSGGAMTAITSVVIKNGGAVFGTYLDTEDWKVKFTDVENSDELARFRGSKYVQSDTLASYSRVSSYLSKGKKVAFVGTPCQVAGLYKYLDSADMNNLFTVDILCHGVPAPGLFKEHIKYLEKKYKKRLTGFQFRDKTKFPNKAALRYEFGKKQVYVLGRCEEYYEVFISGLANRECCYECKYAQKSRVGDLTIGDYWGIKNYHKDFDNTNGVSLILVNNEKGQEILKEADLELMKSKLDYAIEGNGILVHPSNKSSSRDVFYKDVKKIGYENALKQHIKTYPMAYNFILTHMPRLLINILVQVKEGLKV